MSHLFPLDDELGRLNYGCGSGVSWATASHDLDAMFGYLREQYLLQNQKPSDIVAFLIQCLQQVLSNIIICHRLRVLPT